MRSENVLTSFNLLKDTLRGACTQLLAELTRLADRRIDRAVHICQRNAVVVGGCLWPVYQS